MVKKFFLFLILCLTANFQLSLQKEDNQDQNWWKRAVFYQIFPRSFKDSDSDGIGDLGGILEKMDFFTELGVQAIWLSPIYKSPMVDGGYDIQDYRTIAPEYGTMGTFQELVKEAHDRGLKVILDFVPNHTSDQHNWFNNSVNKNGNYSDYYVWRACKKENGTVTYPNNWLSVWGGSMWKYHEKRKECYLHQFSEQQPDLNLRNKKVNEEMKVIMTYWLDMGVDGFRVDAVSHLFESDKFTDEPKNPNSGLPQDNYNYLLHNFTKDQPESKELIYDWRAFIDDYSKKNGGHSRILMTEAATDLANSVSYYGTSDYKKLGAHFSFNFWLIGMSEKSRPQNIVDDYNAWSKALPSNYTMNWLTGNHDNPRIASTVQPRNVDGYNMILAFLDAVSVTYMGEEIGMENGEVTCKQGQDPSATKNCATFNTTSRDFERTPYQWDNTSNAGFSAVSDPEKIWLPVSSKYKETNLRLEKTENRSHFHVYQKLARLKKELSNKIQTAPTNLQASNDSKDVLQITRILANDTYIMVFNMGESSVDMELDTGGSKLSSCEVLVASINATHDTGDKVDGLKLSLKPGDSMILKLVKNGAASLMHNVLFVNIFLVFINLFVNK